MKSIIKFLTIAAVSLSVFSSCSKKEDPSVSSSDTTSVYLEFFNKVGGSELNLDNEWYKNAHGDSFTVSKFNYYISNIVLIGADGTSDYTEANSYHLVEHSSDASLMAFDLVDVPTGNYSAISFMIGVDSLHNVSGAQDGDLDPAKGNFWSWNTGYIMLKFEGNSPQAPTTDGKLTFHCGGFSGDNNVLKTQTLTFSDVLEVKASRTPHIHLQADVLSLFASPNEIDFSTTTTIHMPGADAKKISDNYANLFTVTYAGI